LGKFFDAMQRASTPETEVEPQPAGGSDLPELDQNLLNPEGAEAENEGCAAPPEQPQPVSFETAVMSIRSDVFHVEKSASAQGNQAVSDGPSLKVVKASPKQETSRSIPPRRAVVPPPRAPREDSPLHPAYERIIQRLFAYRSTPRESVILVTSAVPEEGASTVARNIAMALGLHKTERVLLIDANLRSPSQHESFGIGQTEGLGDVLIGPTPLTSAVHEDVVKGLSLLTSGLGRRSSRRSSESQAISHSKFHIQTDVSNDVISTQ